jgi:Tetratricopeptide repeat
LPPAEETVRIRRQLTEANRAAYLPDLALALSNLGVLLNAVGRRVDAVVPAEEAVRYYRQLVQDNPASYLHRLTTALDNLTA